MSSAVMRIFTCILQIWRLQMHRKWICEGFIWTELSESEKWMHVNEPNVCGSGFANIEEIKYPHKHSKTRNPRPSNGPLN